ncbi:hypothetical protein [Bosea sp. PAMC 26642]|uniref:hypothetical protein n=1 Tax=Bosea sp. (strain PAMC 26642) TaxID=1792307 RepID=UPI0007701587|nr:hypothetical protein [Bosea sp. PAMC 26642]AMJ60761.1 hypothetical protein AXW83_11085 [Bosea sp. PAMC 26642]
MTMQTHSAHTSQQRRAQAVYGTLRGRRPMIGLIAAELGVLALITLAIAGFIGLRAWFALAN